MWPYLIRQAWRHARCAPACHILRIGVGLRAPGSEYCGHEANTDDLDTEEKFKLFLEEQYSLIAARKSLQEQIAVGVWKSLRL